MQIIGFITAVGGLSQKSWPGKSQYYTLREESPLSYDDLPSDCCSKGITVTQALHTYV